MASGYRPSRPPVLMVGAFLSKSTGIRFVCEDLAAGLRARGWQVITTSRIKNRALRLVDMLGTVVLMRTHYRVAQVDVYTGAAFTWAEAVALVLRLLRCRFILTLHSGGLPEFAKKHPNRIARLLRSAAAVTSPSPYLQGEFRHLRPDIRVIRNGLHLQRYHPREINSARPLLVWIRAFEERYNPLLALDVVERLSTDHPDVRLLMIGPDRGALTAMHVLEEAHRRGLADRVETKGAIPKDLIPTALEQGDIFLNTTDVDNAPVTVVEAMACGSCVVSTNAGGVPDLVDDGAEALLVPCANAEAMTAAVTRILDDPALALALSVQGRLKAERFSWDTVLDEWEDLLLQVCHSREVAPSKRRVEHRDTPSKP